MKLTIIASLIASAAAFAPASQKSVFSSQLQAEDFSNEIGVQAPLGFFDPLGVLADSDREQFDFYRGIEIKHGRVSMLAVTGYLITANGIRFPGAEGIPDGLKAFPALYESADGKNVLVQMLFFFFLAEIVNRRIEGMGEFQSDFRNGYIDFGWDKYDDATKLKKRSVELNQGRAAMMGITGLVTHELLGSSILPGGYLPGH